MPSATGSPLDLTDFDFGVGRSRLNSRDPHDVSVTIRLPGKNRKTANHEMVFVPYFKKYRLKFKTVAIGKHKNKSQAPIVVFDHQDLGSESALIRKYDKIGGIVNSKAHTLKLLSLFKIEIPSKADEVIKVYFKLHPIVVNENKFNYRICHITLMKTIKNDHEKPHRAYKRKKNKVNPANGQTTTETPSDPIASENNFL